MSSQVIDEVLRQHRVLRSTMRPLFGMCMRGQRHRCSGRVDWRVISRSGRCSPQSVSSGRPGGIQNDPDDHRRHNPIQKQRENFHVIWIGELFMTDRRQTKPDEHVDCVRHVRRDVLDQIGGLPSTNNRHEHQEDRRKEFSDERHHLTSTARYAFDDVPGDRNGRPLGPDEALKFIIIGSVHDCTVMHPGSPRKRGNPAPGQPASRRS
jgi:hypothetical protein